MTSKRIAQRAPIISYFRKVVAKHKNCETCESLGVRWWKGIVHCGKEWPGAAQDRSTGLGSLNQLLLDAISGKSPVICRSHLHFVVFETKNGVEAPYVPPE